MLRRTLALAVLACASIIFVGDPRPGLAWALQTERTQAAAPVSAPIPLTPDEVIMPTTAAAVPVEPAPDAVVVTPAAAPAAEPVPEPTVEPAPPIIAAPIIVAPIRPAPAAPVVPVVAAAQPAPAACPSGWFCYPRVGISGPIVPYGDCSASTDVGTSIRSLTCVSPTFLAAHAYTQFGRITGWSAGDIVFAYGVRYVITGAYTQSSCATPTRAIAPLSLQTSLSANNCGPVLVVQGRPD